MTGVFKIKNPYLQFILIKDLNQVYENELSEALKIKQIGNLSIILIKAYVKQLLV